MQNVLRQAYQADLLLRSAQLVTVGKYPYKDNEVILTSENTYQDEKTEFFTYSRRIDVVIKCENRLKALELAKVLRTHFQSEFMLPLHVGVFQKPRSYGKNPPKSRKYFSYSTLSGNQVLNLIPELQKGNKYKYVIGASPIESNFITNGFDLTYQIDDFRLEHMFLETDNDDKPLDKPMYRLSLYTVSIFEDEVKEDEIEQTEEIVLFHIYGDSKSEIESLAQHLQKQKHEGKKIFTCKGGFPKKELDFYGVTLDKSASDLLVDFQKNIEAKAS